RSQALLGAGRWRPGARRRAGREAAGATPGEVAARHEHANSEYRATVEEAAGRYQALLANEIEDVLGALEAAFERRETPAAPIDCVGDAASVVLQLPPLSAVPDARPVVPRKGKATLQPRSDSERHGLYLSVLASNVLGLVRQSLATAPGLREIRVVAVRPSAALQSGHTLEAVYAGSFDAGEMSQVSWATIDPVSSVTGATGHLLRLAGDGEVVALDLGDEPELSAVLDALHAALNPGPGAP
ncbi:MAG: hypothetical protein M3063_16390, partial [Actinomycetota bacterium]|nr:hypothetical protein [Actinomycetota bacterium]